MASLPLLLSLSLLSLLPPALSLTCTSQKFTNKLYANCSDLPQLGAYLHYTYNASNSSLSVAYVASPAPGGAWVAWAINPVATGMVGSQALMALRISGSVVAKTYNISGYHSIVESKLSFNVWDLSADEANGTMRIFAAVKVPEKAASVNQVWQVGGAVNGTHPSIHPLDVANKASKGTLELQSTGGSPSPAPGPSKGGAPARRGNVGLLASAVLLMGSLTVL
ncbi:auxin-induced in root cultures protein 12-like [Rhodamnia argentea]|uniref:Auxin-induced in root cultures protein 12-like n=1 Tax=Rhodamnia argentea TaxID=178133 RepID=A0A8B8MXY5_9MYRT|nr:auxin-induced in root cultures protein 12-like [Rhodamnia argentea]